MAVYDGNYVTTAEVRAQGVTPAMADDAAVEKAIKAAESQIELWCNRWFYKRTLTLILDGGDEFLWYGFQAESQQTLMIAVPIIALTEVGINDTVRQLINFIALDRIGPIKDDRVNPRIISKNREFPSEGVMNISLTGDFGYVENKTTYDTPALIKTAALKLSIRYLPLDSMTDATRDLNLNSGFIIEEDIPGYHYKLSDKAFGESGDPSVSASYSGDPEIDGIIDMYRYKRFCIAV